MHCNRGKPSDLEKSVEWRKCDEHQHAGLRAPHDHHQERGEERNAEHRHCSAEHNQSECRAPEHDHHDDTES